MDYQNIARLILETMQNDEWSLRDRLYGILTGPLLAIGPPWPEDPEAYRLLSEVDQKMRRIQAALPPDPTRGRGADHMLVNMSESEVDDLAAAILRFAERMAAVSDDLPRTPGGDPIH